MEDWEKRISSERESHWLAYEYILCDVDVNKSFILGRHKVGAKTPEVHLKFQHLRCAKLIKTRPVLP